MSQWKRIHEKAAGSLPVATLTKWGGMLIALLLAAFLLTQSLFNTAPEPVEVATGSQEPAGPERKRSYPSGSAKKGCGRSNNGKRQSGAYSGNGNSELPAAPRPRQCCRAA